MKIAIIDYHMGNLFSVNRALAFIGMESIITNNRQEILNADAAILPGVGAFGEAIHNLKKDRLDRSILDFIDSGKPFMGICLGMQLLFSKSYEFGEFKGLSVIKGDVIHFNYGALNGLRVKVPHVSWSQVWSMDKSWENTLLNDNSDGTYMYFVHSYYAKPEQEKNLISTTVYEGKRYCSGIKKENVEAFQFHPEKSGPEGLKILKQFKERIKRGS